MAAKKRVPIPQKPEARVNVATADIERDDGLSFSFKRFKQSCINIAGFNNHFENEEHYLSVWRQFTKDTLFVVSQEKRSTLFSADNATTGALRGYFHLHPIRKKDALLKRIFEEYKYSESEIDNFIEGARIYQMEIRSNIVKTRIVFHYVDGVLYFLFFDTNHHIYMDEEKTRHERSLSNGYCIKNDAIPCPMAYGDLPDCPIREYIDWVKYGKSLGYTYDPENNGEGL